MPCKSDWRKRVKGSRRQVGKSFRLDTQSAQSKKGALPAVKGARMMYPTGRTVEYSTTNMKVSQLPVDVAYKQEKNKPNFEARVQHFINMYNRGETIPPILFHREGDGAIVILDGRARIEAFRRLRVSHIPAVENATLSDIYDHLGRVAKYEIKREVSSDPKKLEELAAKVIQAQEGALSNSYPFQVPPGIASAKDKIIAAKKRAVQEGIETGDILD